MSTPSTVLAYECGFLHMKSMYELLKNNEATDVHFVFNVNGQLKKISAHKVVLAAASPVFKAMFYGPLKENGDVKMVEESSISFEVFFSAIYNQLDAINMSNIGDVMSLADKYDTKTLMHYCSQFLAQNLNTNNVCFVMNLALRYKQRLLQTHCDIIMALQWKAVLSTEAFLEVDCDTLEHIVQINCMSRNEKEIFDACIKWAQKSCERKLIDATPDKLRAELGQCLVHIKFNRMSQSEFVECERLHPIFTFDEYKNIIRNFNNETKKAEPTSVVSSNRASTNKISTRKTSSGRRAVLIDFKVARTPKTPKTSRRPRT